MFFTNFFDCDGTPVQEDVDVSGNFLFNQRGSGPFPYERESSRGTFAWTNLNTGGTFTNVFTSNSRDHTIVDNGDGTITITSFVSRRFSLLRPRRQPGAQGPRPDSVRLRDRPQRHTGNPDDDLDVPGSFRTLRDSTGRTDTVGRDFCADVVEFTG